MKNYTLILLCAILLLGCNSNETKSEEEITQLNIELAEFYAPYSIHFLESNNVNLNLIQNIISENLPKFVLVDSISIESEKFEYTLIKYSNPKKEFPAPDLEYLEFSKEWLTEDEMQRLQEPKLAFCIEFAGPTKNIVEINVKINKIIHEILKLDHCIATDLITYESFNLEGWNNHRVKLFNDENLDFASQFVIHSYRDGQYCRSVTLGLGKFGLPDISIQNTSCSNTNSYVNLINLLAQSWIENPYILSDSTMNLKISKIKDNSVRTYYKSLLEENTKGSTSFLLSEVTPQEGDAYNKQLEIVFRDESFSSIQEEQDYMVSNLFGSNDEIINIDHNQEILEASERAKQKLPELKKQFNDSLGPGESILVKAPFLGDDGGNEWMWVEVIEWKGSKIKGILQNDPYTIKNLSAGAIVNISQRDVFDYIFYKADGSEEGNETGALLEKANGNF